MIQRSGERTVKLTRYSQTDAINPVPRVYAYIKDITMHLHRIWQNADSNRHVSGDVRNPAAIWPGPQLPFPR